MFVTFPRMLPVEVSKIIVSNQNYVYKVWSIYIDLISNIEFVFFYLADCQEPWVRPGSSVACYTTGQDKMNFKEAIAVRLT